MKLSSILSSLICTAAVVPGLNSKDMKQFESLRAIPPGWQSIGSPEPDTRMAFKIALKLVCNYSPEMVRAYKLSVVHSRTFSSSS